MDEREPSPTMDDTASTPSPTSANTPPPPGTAPPPNKRYRPAPAKTFQCRGYGECRMVFSRSEHLARHIRYVRWPVCRAELS